ncbi:class I SAM-dependent methyltransferase [Acidisoma sp. L85]|uniref:class I SAM-dependent methyltransferase n=1 Tax=Acidisoma sp. L85 TaxID=1641850 RepID=UPI00131BFF89|nr:class I SAM-dependent methyltransferase [Acidisoma sp. L85]
MVGKISRSSPMGRKAYELCHGLGLEIGALHQPFDLEATVIYLDREDMSRLKRSYSGDPREAHIQAPQLVAKSIPYSFIAAEAFDFVLSSHVLEHFPNPGMALEEWLRITKPGGIIYAILPNRDKTFDAPRAITSSDVLMNAFISRDNTAPLEQYIDFYANHTLAPGTARFEREVVERHWRTAVSIHVYTFTPESVSEFLRALQTKLAFDIVHEDAEKINIHFALRKR